MAIDIELIWVEPSVVAALELVNESRNALLAVCNRPEPGPFDDEIAEQILALARKYKNACNTHNNAIAVCARTMHNATL